jgi:hypothetical protein
MAGAILIILAMALVFPPLVFGGGMVLSGLFGWLFTPDEIAAESEASAP